MFRVICTCVAEPRNRGVSAASVVTDVSDGSTLAEAVAFLTEKETELTSRPEELAMRAAFAALPGVARGIVDAVVVAGADAAIAARVGVDVGKPSATAEGANGWGLEEEEAREVGALGARYVPRARALLGG